MPSVLELQDLYNEALVRETLEKTKRCGITWSLLGGTQFHASYDDDGTTWDFYITKTQVGSVSYKYSLDVKKESASFVTITDGPLPHTNRDSVVKSLYEVVEILVLELDKKVKEAVRLIQDMPGCSD